MRPVNIVLLVLAGAFGGAVVMKVMQRPHPTQAVAAEPEAVVPVSVPAPPTVPEPAVQPPAAVATEPAAMPEPQPAMPAVTKPFPARRRILLPPKLPPKRVEFQRSAPTVVAQVQTPPPAAAPTPALTPEQPKETPPGNMEPEEVTPLPAPIPVPPEVHKVTLNAGMLIPVRLVDSLSLERNQVGDRFTATLDRELDADGFVIAERGARVEGRVVIADRSAKTLGIELTSVATSDRQEASIQTERFDKHNEPDRAEDLTKVGAGAVIGAVIGGLAGGGKGAAIGAGVGSGAGAGGVMLGRKPITLPSETRITFRLRAPLTITEQRE
jgi:hypothetical protein